jgi:DNA-binding response OmpR family regulator
MRILVADQNSLLLAAITATFGRHCEVFTASRRDACLAQVEQHRFDVVIACDKLADYTGLELLSEVPVISPDTLLIFAADPKRLKQLGKRLAVFGLFETLTYPLTPQKLVEVLKRARESLGARTPPPKVRHVVLESEWDTGERLALVERELQAEVETQGRAATHEEWAKASEVGAAQAEKQAQDDAEDFVFAGPPPAVQAMAAPPRADARPDGRARTFDATPVAATHYEVKPATSALRHEAAGGGVAGTGAGDGADEFVFAVEPDPVAALRESRIETEGSTLAEADGEREPTPDELCSNDAVFEVSESPRRAKDRAANDIAFRGLPVEPASWRRGGTGSLPMLTCGSAGVSGESRPPHGSEPQATTDARGAARSAHAESPQGHKGAHSQRTDSGRASDGAASSQQAKPSQGQNTGRSSYLEAALAANIAAHANFGKAPNAARPGRDASAQASSVHGSNSAQAAGHAKSAQALGSAGQAKSAQALGSTGQADSSLASKAAGSVSSSQPAKSARSSTSHASESSEAAKATPGGKAARTGTAAKAPSSKGSPQPRARTQAKPTASQLAAFERAVARRNSGDATGSDSAVASRRGRRGGSRSEPTLQVEKVDHLFAGGQPSKSLSELAKIASAKRPLGVNNVAVPKRTVFAVSSGLAVLVLGVLSFELLRNSGEAEHHMPHAGTQAQSMQVFSSTTTMVAKGDRSNTAQLVAPPPPEEPVSPPPGPIQPQAIEYNPDTAPPDPPPPPVLEHPGPMEPSQPPYTKGYTGSVVDGVPQNPEAPSQ